MKIILSLPAVAFCAIVFLAGTSHAQSLQWHRKLAGNAPNWSRCYDMTLDANGNVFVVGIFHGTIDFGSGPVTSTQNGNDFYFAVYNSNGVLQLFRRIGAANTQVVGQGVSLFNSGGTVFLYVTGHFTSLNGQLLSVNFDPDGSPSGLLSMNDTEGDAFVAKYNVTNGGTFVWARRIANTRAYGFGGKISTDATGNAYTVSIESVGTNNDKSRIARHSVNGNPDWNRATNGLAYDVAFRGTSVFVCGKSLSIANGRGLARLNAGNGNLQSTFGSTTQEFWALALDNSTGIYVVGKNGINSVMKFTTGTSPIWTKAFEASSGPSVEFDIAVVGPGQNQVMVTGSFTGTVNFNGGSGSQFTITSSGPALDIFAARYNSSNGSCLWVKSYQRQLPGGLTYPLSVAGNSQNFLINGHLEQNTSIDIDFCGGVANVSVDNTTNAFLAQYSLLTSHNALIVTDGVVCTTGTPVTVSNAVGGNVTWSVSPTHLLVNNTGTGTTANLQANSGVKGQATITFTFNGTVDECGIPLPATLNRTLWIGPPNGGIAGPDVVYPQQNYFYENATPSTIDGGFDYQWTIYGGVFNGINYNTAIAFWNETGTIHLDYENLCGRFNTIMEVTVTTEGGCNPCTIMQTYPNPASDELNIVFNTDVEGTADATTASDNEVALVNSNQKIVYSTVTKANEITINTTELPDGKYFLIVKNNNGTDARQILIKH